MLKKIKKLTLLALMGLLMSLKGYSQTIQLNEKSDTTICFTIPQSKFLLKEHYRADKNAELLNVANQQLNLCDSLKNSFTATINKQSGIIKNRDEYIATKDFEIQKLNDQIKDLNGEVKKQKLLKWVSIGGAGAIAGLFGYYVITH